MLFEIRYALRRVLRSPGYVAIVLLSLTIGMGTVLTMLGVTDVLLLRAPMAREHQRVVGIGSWTSAERLSYPDYLDLREATVAFDDIAAFAVLDYSLRVGAAVLPAHGLLASHTLLPLLRVQPVRGRTFSADEDRSGAEPVMLISHGVWQQRFAGDPRVVGASIGLAGRSFTVIGVLPEGFTAPDMSSVDVMLPVANAPWLGGAEGLASRDFRWLRLLGRLRAEATPAQAAAEVTTIYRRVNEGVRAVDQSTLSTVVVPVRSVVDARHEPGSPSSRASKWLTLLAMAVLFIACANVASVLIARRMRERSSLAMQAILGAGRTRLIGRIVVEIALLVGASCVFAIGLAKLSGVLLTEALLSGTIQPPPLDYRALAAAAGLALVTGAVCAVGPIADVLRLDLRGGVAGSARTVARSGRTAFRGLLIVQVSLSVVLVSEAAVFGASLNNALRLDYGFDLDRLLVADIDLRTANITDDAALAAIRRAREAVSSVRGVAAAGVTNAALTPGYLSIPVTVPGEQVAPRAAEARLPSINAVSSGYLEALGSRLLIGRIFNRDDAEAQRNVAVVSERFARRYWPDGRALGKCVTIGVASPSNCGEIIGVVSNRRAGPLDPDGALDVYVPLGSRLIPQQVSAVFPGREIVIRTTDSNQATADAVRAAIMEALPSLPLVRVRSGAQYMERQFRTWRMGAGLLGAFGVLALALASIGVFGVSAHYVGQRTRELGIRAALGARRTELRALVLSEIIRVTLVGIILGIALAFPAARISQGLAFGISPFNPLIYVATVIVLLGVATMAGLPSAVRAGAVDPSIALQGE